MKVRGTDLDRGERERVQRRALGVWRRSPTRQVVHVARDLTRELYAQVVPDVAETTDPEAQSVYFAVLAAVADARVGWIRSRSEERAAFGRLVRELRMVCSR